MGIIKGILKTILALGIMGLLLWIGVFAALM